MQVILWIFRAREGLVLESRQVNTTPIRNQRNCRERGPLSKRWYLCTSASVMSFRKMVARRDGMLLLLAQQTRPSADGKSQYQSPLIHLWKSRLHQFCAKMLAGRFTGYSLNSGGGWTGDSLITDWHDIEKNVASEPHVQRSKSKEIEIKNLQDAFILLFADGSLNQ